MSINQPQPNIDRRLEKNAPIRAFIDHIEKTDFHGKVELTVQAGRVVRWEEKVIHLADDYLPKTF